MNLNSLLIIIFTFYSLFNIGALVFNLHYINLPFSSIQSYTVFLTHKQFTNNQHLCHSLRNLCCFIKVLLC